MQLLLATRSTGFTISLPCVKGGGIFTRKWRRDCCSLLFPLFVLSVAFHNPSVSHSLDSSLYTREPLTLSVSAKIWSIENIQLLFCRGVHRTPAGDQWSPLRINKFDPQKTNNYCFVGTGVLDCPLSVLFLFSFTQSKIWIWLGIMTYFSTDKCS